MGRVRREASEGAKIVPIGRHRTVPTEDRAEGQIPGHARSRSADISPFIVFRRDHTPTSEWWLVAGEPGRLHGRAYDGWRRDGRPETIGNRIGWRPIVAGLAVVGPFWLLISLLVIVLQQS